LCSSWEAVGQSALNGLASALPGVAIGLISLFGKRQVQTGVDQLLSQLPINEIAQIIEIIVGTDKANVLSELRKALERFFPKYVGRLNFDQLAANIVAQADNLLPALSESLFLALLG
jgi:hypothetical protein